MSHTSASFLASVLVGSLASCSSRPVLPACAPSSQGSASSTPELAFSPASAPSGAASPHTLRQLYGLQPTDRIAIRHTAVVLVDFQEEFFRGQLAIANAPAAAERAAALLTWARQHGVAVVHVRNVAKPGSVVFAPESPTTAIVAPLAPREGEILITKSTGGGFTKTTLDQVLRTRGVDTIIVGGIMTHLAVAMTTQDGTVLGYRVVVAGDATTTRDLPGVGDTPPVPRAQLQQAALAAIADRFADVMTTERIVSLPVRVE